MTIEAITYLVDWTKLVAAVSAGGPGVLDPNAETFLRGVPTEVAPMDTAAPLLRTMMAASATLGAMASVAPGHAALDRVRAFADMVFMCHPHPGCNELGPQRAIAFGPERAAALLRGLEDGDIDALRPVHAEAVGRAPEEVMTSFDAFARYMESVMAIVRSAQAARRGVVSFCA